jgi:RHS repeat-associated protein
MSMLAVNETSMATHSGATTVYGYDGAQNRVMKKSGTGGSPVDAYSFTFANKLTNITAGSAIASHRYAYDAAGNLTNLVSTTATNRYSYNAQNKLVRIEGRGFTNAFAYDSQNRRIGVKLDATWRYDVHDGNICIGSVVNGLLDRFFVRGAGIAEGTGDIIAEIIAPHILPQPYANYYYIGNHRGDTLLVLDYMYNTAARYEYDAFGNVIEKTGSFTPRFTFSTKEYLPDAKLYLYAYRVYDPVAGRWTQRDPIDYQDSLNLYQFCGNNPQNSMDADGRFTLIEELVAGVLLGGALVGALYVADRVAQQSAHAIGQGVRQGNPDMVNSAVQNLCLSVSAATEASASILDVVDAIGTIIDASAITKIAEVQVVSGPQPTVTYNTAAKRYQTTVPVPNKPGRPFATNRAGDNALATAAGSVRTKSSPGGAGDFARRAISDQVGEAPQLEEDKPR